MSQITIRNIQPAVEQTIRQMAEDEHISLNEVCNKLLEKALDYKGSSIKKRDLSSLAGTWTQEDYLIFERNQEMFNTVDDEVWR
jgi:hypothetical protein